MPPRFYVWRVGIVEDEILYCHGGTIAPWWTRHVSHYGTFFGAWLRPFPTFGREGSHDTQAASSHGALGRHEQWRRGSRQDRTGSHRAVGQPRARFPQDEGLGFSDSASRAHPPLGDHRQHRAALRGSQLLAWLRELELVGFLCQSDLVVHIEQGGIASNAQREQVDVGPLRHPLS
jgi:hypothetical protein